MDVAKLIEKEACLAENIADYLDLLVKLKRFKQAEVQYAVQDAIERLDEAVAVLRAAQQRLEKD